MRKPVNRQRAVCEASQRIMSSQLLQALLEPGEGLSRSGGCKTAEPAPGHRITAWYTLTGMLMARK